MNRRVLSVAVPWSLSHYIPLNGFDPQYRALFDACPPEITLNAWDNAKLSNMLRADASARRDLLDAVAPSQAAFGKAIKSVLAPKYLAAFDPPNIALTALLPGDVEFHHTAPFPSLTRPFVFHCESFEPIFLPFCEPGGSVLREAGTLREHYEKLFADPLCLGIFSPIPQTLAELSRFFGSREIDSKLRASRCGLSGQCLTPPAEEKPPALAAPRFLFMDSETPDPADYRACGGHIILRFWLEFIETCPDAKLYLRGIRPGDEVLAGLGVDPIRLRREESRSVIWIEEFVSPRERNRLMSRADFFLAPGASLHSVSIMQAMALGAVPFVAGTIGASHYVTHGEDGIVLHGMLTHRQEMRSSPDHGHRSPRLEDDMVRQLADHVRRLLDKPGEYAAMRTKAMHAGATRFSGAAFAQAFWGDVQELWDHCPAPPRPAHVSKAPPVLPRHCLLEPAGWQRVFEGASRPMPRIYTGRGRVTEWAGAFVYTAGPAPVEPHQWSVLAEYASEAAPPLVFAQDIRELGGVYLTAGAIPASRRIVGWVEKLLSPYPRAHRLAARLFKLALRLKGNAGSQNAPAEIDIPLAVQSLAGMKIIRSGRYYYAIPQNAGDFSEARAKANFYPVCFKGRSLKHVLEKIAQYARENQSQPAAHGSGG